MTQFKIMTVFGTRPEAIKMAPVVAELRKRPSEFRTCVVVTAQHRSMLDQVLDIFQIQPDYDLDIMRSRQSLAAITVRALTGLDRILRREKPDLVLVQGDTTTSFVGALAAFYRKIPVGHVEAGLRTGDKYNPFPEEINRCLVDVFADLCFAPTLTARNALLSAGTLESRIFVTGNTVIDALQAAVHKACGFAQPALRQLRFRPPRRTLLVTAHRRESFGPPMEAICRALRVLLTTRKDLQVVFPVHLNPNVRNTVSSLLGDVERAWLTDPLDYLDFVQLMQAADLILTDSGGVQEEAPALGKPVLVCRETTERPEAVAAGTSRLVGTDSRHLVAAVSQLLDDPVEYSRMAHAANPYGDGHAAERVVGCLRYFLGLTPAQPAPFQSSLGPLAPAWQDVPPVVPVNGANGRGAALASDPSQPEESSIPGLP